MKIYILIFSLFIFCYSLFSEDAFVAVSEKDKDNIEYIFDYLFKFDEFSYTLFGDKPMSFEHINTSYVGDLSLINYCVLFSYKKPVNFLETSWEAWKSKYGNIKFKNYLFFDKENSHYKTIILINKKAFLQVCDNNKNLFKKVFGIDFTAEMLLKRLTSKELTLEEALNNHQGLLGILLGYGTNNSILFHNKNKFIRNKTSKKVQAVNPYFYWISLIQPVRFIGDIKHPETIQLLDKYEKVNTRVSNIYKEKKLVDAIISKLRE